MSDFSLPTELNQPFPRCVKARRSFVIIVCFVITAFMGMGLAMTGLAYKSCYDHAVLKERGVAVDATVTGLNIEYGKSSQYYKVTYQFPSPAVSGHGAVDQTTTRQTLKSNYDNLAVGQSVPILYDPENLDRSDLNFNDVLHKSAPYAMMKTIYWLMGIMFGSPTVFIILVMFPSYFREKKLLQFGYAAPAIILGTEVISGRRPSVTATFQFTDQHGKTVDGTQKYLPTEAQRKSRKRFNIYWDNIMTNPVALYDPKDSSKNMLYMSGSARCYLP